MPFRYLVADRSLTGRWQVVDWSLTGRWPARVRFWESDLPIWVTWSGMRNPKLVSFFLFLFAFFFFFCLLFAFSMTPTLADPKFLPFFFFSVFFFFPPGASPLYVITRPSPSAPQSAHTTPIEHSATKNASQYLSQSPPPPTQIFVIRVHPLSIPTSLLSLSPYLFPLTGYHNKWTLNPRKISEIPIF